jgi:hypothetical protein
MPAEIGSQPVPEVLNRKQELAVALQQNEIRVVGDIALLDAFQHRCHEFLPVVTSPDVFDFPLLLCLDSQLLRW